MKTLITFAKRNVYKIVPRRFWLFLVENRSIFTDLTEGEILFFNLINNCCRTIVDIGARTDVFYSFNPPPDKQIVRKVFMFEANPFFSKVLKKKLESAPVHGDFKVFSCGIGAEESEMYYFHDTQSFLKESNMGNVSKVRSFKPIKVVPLNKFAEELRECDFLKTDIEEMDFFALLGASKILANVHFIQFELGIGADFNDRKVMNEDYYSLLEADFDLFVLRDNNPIWEAFPTLPLLITLNSGTKLLLKILQSSGVGFNIVGINKKKLFPEFLVPEISLLSFH